MTNEVSRIRQGSIVWAEIIDQAGKPAGKHPVLIITSDNEIEAGATLVAGLGISTSIPDPPHDNQVPLPWNPTGHVTTRLRRRCAVVCDWAVQIETEKAIWEGGFLPTKKLIEVMEKRQHFLPGK